MSQMIASDGIFKSGGKRVLPHHRTKGGRTVFTGRNNKIIHIRKNVCLINANILEKLRNFSIKKSFVQKTGS
jgi:hypothetical protein